MAVLAHYTDATGHELTYRLTDAVADAQRTDREHPDASGTPALRLWIGQQVVQHVLLLEAQAARTRSRSAGRKRIDANVENGLLETVYDDEIATSGERHARRHATRVRRAGGSVPAARGRPRSEPHARRLGRGARTDTSRRPRRFAARGREDAGLGRSGDGRARDVPGHDPVWQALRAPDGHDVEGRMGRSDARRRRLARVRSARQGNRTPRTSIG